MKEKFLPPFYRFPCKRIIWQHLVRSVHTSHTYCSRTLLLVLFYVVPPLTMVPQPLHPHGHWLGKKHHACPSTWWPKGDPVGVIFFHLFFPFYRKCLFRHFFSVRLHCAYCLCLTSP
jgi:hypothetical protein